MENQKIRTERTVCDFCGEENAVLYCGSDSAKLCLICDHHVHSANALSRKHLRSQLCDNCSSVPVSVRCSTDNLVLCQECDWDAHGSCSVSIQHERQAVEGFSGCPSAQELASIWGFDLSDKSLLLPQFSQNESDLDSIFGFFIRERSTYDNSRNPNVSGRFGADSTDSWLPKTAVNLDDLIVPAENLRSYLNVPCAKIPSLSKHQNPTCGKRKQVIFQQLIELLKKDLTPKNNATVLEPSCNLSPSTPNQNGQLRSLKSPDLRDGGGDQVVDADPFDRPLLQNPYSSLLMLPEHPDFGDNCLVEDDIFWDCSALDQANEIWDFHSRKFRDQGEHAPVEVGYGTDDSNFRVKCYNGLMEETSLVTAEVLEDIYDLNHPLTHQDISLTDIQHISPQDPDIKRLTSTWRNSSNNQASLGPFLIKGDILETATKVDSELLAYNRECDVALQGEKENTQANTTTILSNWTCGGCRFDKNIRYESRKARAGTRKRANGRFVKAGEGVGIEISS